jgi:hypothetical protein
VIRTFDKRPGIFIRDKPFFSSERMLHKDYDRNGSVGKKKSLVLSLKGLGAKTNRLAVNHQSYSNCDFDFNFEAIQWCTETTREPGGSVGFQFCQTVKYQNQE